MGVYVFKPKVLTEILEKNKKADFGKEIIPLSIGKKKVHVYPFTNYWKDIGTISAFFEANLELAQQNPPFSLYHPKWPFYSTSRPLPPTSIIQSDIRDSLIVEGTSITGARIANSVLGMRSIIGKNTMMRNVIMNGADFYEGEQVLNSQRTDCDIPLGVGKNCVIHSSIIDKNARIGNDVIIREKHDVENTDTEMYYIRDGITIIPKGTVIPDGTVI
jgi:glucose-1-phosphate adenylyltransferase